MTASHVEEAKEIEQVVERLVTLRKAEQTVERLRGRTQMPPWVEEKKRDLQEKIRGGEAQLSDYDPVLIKAIERMLESIEEGARLTEVAEDFRERVGDQSGDLGTYIDFVSSVDRFLTTYEKSLNEAA